MGSSSCLILRTDRRTTLRKRFVTITNPLVETGIRGRIVEREGENPEVFAYALIEMVSEQADEGISTVLVRVDDPDVLCGIGHHLVAKSSELLEFIEDTQDYAKSGQDLSLLSGLSGLTEEEYDTPVPGKTKHLNEEELYSYLEDNDPS